MCTIYKPLNHRSSSGTGSSGGGLGDSGGEFAPELLRPICTVMRNCHTAMGQEFIQHREGKADHGRRDEGLAMNS